MKTSRIPVAAVAASAALALALVVSGCTAATTSTISNTTPSAADPSTAASGPSDTSAVVGTIAWADAMTVTVNDGSVEVVANGIPNHERDAQYAVPTGGTGVPDASSSVAVDDPTSEQNYDFTITTTPTYVDEVTAAPQGSIGIMISGAVLFNPYEGDGTTVAMANNFSIIGDDGTEVWFVDSCSGHPSPNGAYHYHGLPSCVWTQVDEETGASHIIGLALDGFPIYGANDIDGNPVDVATLDECNGITSATPEFPEGIYHYVLPGTLDETSSIRCFHGEVDSSQILTMPPMNGMPGMDAMDGMDGMPPADGMPARPGPGN